MGAQTAISWTDHTFNPWWGCERVSPGCRFCYAESFAKRTGHDVWGKGERRFFGDKHWAEPLKWNKAAFVARRPALVFCASMADVFEDRPDLVPHRRHLFELIRKTPHLQWQLLTKRPENVLWMVPRGWLVGGWPDNAWMGTTVEDQERADERVPVLLTIPAPVRFLSCEPLLGPVDLGLGVDHRGHAQDYITTDVYPQCLDCSTDDIIVDWTYPDGPRIGWIIVGGESGPHHRALNLDHARALRNQAVAAQVPFLFKQVGGLHPKSGGDELDGERWHQFPPQAGDRVAG